MNAKENVRYLFKGVDVDLKTREYIEKKLANLEKFSDKILQAEVEVDLDKKNLFRVEIMIKTPRNLFRSEDTTESIEASTDLAIDEIQKQMTHLKDKLRTVKKRGAMSIKKKVVIDENARF